MYRGTSLIRNRLSKGWRVSRGSLPPKRQEAVPPCALQSVTWLPTVAVDQLEIGFGFRTSPKKRKTPTPALEETEPCAPPHRSRARPPR